MTVRAQVDLGAPKVSGPCAIPMTARIEKGVAIEGKRAVQQRLKQILQPLATARLLRLQCARFSDARQALLNRFPQHLAPRQVYGME